jgi:hypothetical protein
VSATIGRDHVVDFVVGNRRPYTVHFNFVVVANHATLGRPTIHYIAARAPAVISSELRVEALMPFIVACSVVSFLRGRRAYTRTHGHRAAKKGDERAPGHEDAHLNNALRFRRDTGRHASLAYFYCAPRTAFLGSCYHQILGPCLQLPKPADGLCRHCGAWVYLDPHLIRQATDSYVQCCKGFGFVPHQGFRSLRRMSMPPAILQSVCACGDGPKIV